MFGEEVENGELPNDIAWIGKVIQDICYNNARDYFNLQYLDEKTKSTATV
jgi:glucuronate isomerase